MNDGSLEEGGTMPPDNLYIGFSPNNKQAQEFSDLITSEIIDMRKTGELAKILATYGLSDWESWSPNHRDLFTGKYTERLKQRFSYDPLNEKEDWQAKARSIWPDLYFRVGEKNSSIMY